MDQIRTIVKNAHNGGVCARNGCGAIAQIADSARQIDQIIGVIADMSLQTNLRALNVSLDPAIAGDPAKDVAVATSEVCALACIAEQVAQISGAISEISASARELNTASGRGVEPDQGILQIDDGGG